MTRVLIPSLFLRDYREGPAVRQGAERLPNDSLAGNIASLPSHGAAIENLVRNGAQAFAPDSGRPNVSRLGSRYVGCA